MESALKRSTISLCMIVRDEEDNLPRCLDSVKDLLDEIIIVDTGSKDKTVEIAKSYGAKVYYFEWCDDFSAARNEALKYATKEWIFVMDADEYIDEENKSKIKNLLQSPAYDAYCINTKNWISQHIPVWTVNALTRLYRNMPGIYYTGKVHNDIDPSLLKLGIESAFTDIFIYHTGYLAESEEAKNKGERSIKILKELYDKSPDEPWVNFYLAGKYKILEKYNLAIEHLRKVITNPSAPSHITAFSYAELISYLNELKRYDEAIEVGKKAFKLCGGQPIFHLLVAESYHKKKEYQKAIEELELGLTYTIDAKTHSIINVEIAPAVFYVRMGENYESLGEKDKALIHYRTAIELKPDFPTPYLRIANLYLNQGNYRLAVNFFQKFIDLVPASPEVHMRLGNIYAKLGNYEEAKKVSRYQGDKGSKEQANSSP